MTVEEYYMQKKEWLPASAFKVKQRRIFKKVETREEASLAVQEMQDEIYGNTDFKRASEL